MHSPLDFGCVDCSARRGTSTFLFEIHSLNRAAGARFHSCMHVQRRTVYLKKTKKSSNNKTTTNCCLLSCHQIADDGEKSGGDGSSSTSAARRFVFLLLAEHISTRPQQFALLLQAPPPAKPSYQHHYPHPPKPHHRLRAEPALVDRAASAAPHTLSPSLIALMCCDCVGVAFGVRWVGKGVGGVAVVAGWGGCVAAKSVLQ